MAVCRRAQGGVKRRRDSGANAVDESVMPVTVGGGFRWRMKWRKINVKLE
jgi:hypothetical protein